MVRTYTRGVTSEESVHVRGQQQHSVSVQQHHGGLSCPSQSDDNSAAKYQENSCAVRESKINRQLVETPQVRYRGPSHGQQAETGCKEANDPVCSDNAVKQAHAAPSDQQPLSQCTTGTSTKCNSSPPGADDNFVDECSDTSSDVDPVYVPGDQQPLSLCATDTRTKSNAGHSTSSTDNSFVDDESSITNSDADPLYDETLDVNDISTVTHGQQDIDKSNQEPPSKTFHSQNNAPVQSGDSPKLVQTGDLDSTVSPTSSSTVLPSPQYTSTSTISFCKPHENLESSANTKTDNESKVAETETCGFLRKPYHDVRPKCKAKQCCGPPSMKTESLLTSSVGRSKSRLRSQPVNSGSGTRTPAVRFSPVEMHKDFRSDIFNSSLLEDHDQQLSSVDWERRDASCRPKEKYRSSEKEKHDLGLQMINSYKKTEFRSREKRNLDVQSGVSPEIDIYSAESNCKEHTSHQNLEQGRNKSYCREEHHSRDFHSQNNCSESKEKFSLLESDHTLDDSELYNLELNLQLKLEQLQQQQEKQKRTIGSSTTQAEVNEYSENERGKVSEKLAFKHGGLQGHCKCRKKKGKMSCSGTEVGSLPLSDENSDMVSEDPQYRSEVNLPGNQTFSGNCPLPRAQQRWDYGNSFYNGYIHPGSIPHVLVPAYPAFYGYARHTVHCSHAVYPLTFAASYGSFSYPRPFIPCSRGGYVQTQMSDATTFY